MWLNALQRDLSYGMRRLWREPAFTVAAILILAVGIGSSTAIFSIVHAVLLRPFGVQSPDRVLMMWPGDSRHDSVGEFPFAAARDMRARLRSFDDVALVGSVNWWGTIMMPDGMPLGLSASAVSAGFFDVLGAHPMLGRTFRPEDDEPSAPRVLVLSHAVWTDHFSADAGVIGRIVSVKEEAPAEPFEIIGVMPAEFFFPRGAGYWTPAGGRLARIARHQGGRLEPLIEGLQVFHGLARLRQGTTLSAARAELDLFIRTMAGRRETDPTGARVILTPLVDHIFGAARPALLVLMGAVLVVLLLACTNVAGLLFARGASRGRELAVRAALGASRTVLMRQLLVESSLLGLVAAIVGISAASLGVDAIVALSPLDVPRLDAAAVDQRVLGLALTGALLTTIMFGLVPACHFSQPSTVESLKGSAGGVATGTAPARTRRALITCQMAATLVLLVVAGLCVQSFARLARLDLGFDPANVLTFNVAGLDQTRYPARALRHAVIEQLVSRFERLPHVTAAGAVHQRPFEHGPVGMDARFLLEGQPDTPETRRSNPMLNWESVAGSYFRSMGIRVVRGRIFDERDTENSPTVAIVSEAMVARLWPGEDPIGKRLRLLGGQEDRWKTVVGVVATARYREIESPRLDIYVPLRQAESDVHHFTLRTTTDPLAVASTVTKEISSVDAGLSIGAVKTMNEIVGRVRAPWRFTMQVFGLFGVVALMLTSAGVFGLAAYEVSQRRREIGIRMALGAGRRTVVGLMMRQAARPAAAGLTVGLLAALLGTRVLSRLLFGVSSTDPATFAGVLILLASVALLASYLPARRAASVDPQVVLRE
jgi:predicted permease